MIKGVHTMFYTSEPEAGIEDHGYGLVTHFGAPGGFEIQLYEPRYSRA